jgi:hypothetical protein
MISCVLFIMGIKKLGKADTARKGNLYSSVGMLIAVVSVLISQDVIDGGWLSYLLIVLAIAGGSVVGFIFFILIFVVGHLVNIGLNALGSYVHTMRLQYVEMFGKFYEGGGNEFEPFSLQSKYIKIQEDK